jgi:hypothetical protein
MATFQKVNNDLSITKEIGGNVKIVRNGCFNVGVGVDVGTYMLTLVTGIKQEVTDIKIKKWETNKWGAEIVKKNTELSNFFKDNLTVSVCPGNSGIPSYSQPPKKPPVVVGTNPLGITEEEREEEKENEEKIRQRIQQLQQNSANFRAGLEAYKQGLADNKWKEEMNRKIKLLSRGLKMVMRENTTYINLSEEEKKTYINEVINFTTTQANKKNGTDCLANVQQLRAAEQEGNLDTIATTCIAAYDKYKSISMSGARRRNRTKHRRSRHKRTRRYRKN